MKSNWKNMTFGFLGGLVGFAAAAALNVPANAANVPESDEPIKLAMNEWTGQHITTQIAGEILKRAGYNVEYVTAGYFPQWQALADGTLTASLEIWSNNVGDNWEKAEASGNVVKLGDLGLDTNEGWMYPKHVAELCPGLPDWKALADCAETLATSDTFPNGRILSYPADWGTRSADIIAGLDIPFEAVPAGSEGALVAELKSAVAKKEPLVMMFWAPHWIFAEVDVDWVALPKYDAACAEDASWGPNPNKTNDCGVDVANTFKVAWVGMKDKWPVAHKFLSDFQMAAPDQEPMMKAVDVDGEDLQAVVKAWVDANEATWKPWLDAAMQ